MSSYLSSAIFLLIFRGNEEGRDANYNRAMTIIPPYTSALAIVWIQLSVALAEGVANIYLLIPIS
jgi:hypothetical protein